MMNALRRVASGSSAPYLALLGAILTLCAGTSFAKQLFPTIGAAGACAWRVGASALILCAVWRPWRMRCSRGDAGLILAYGAAMGAMNLCFYMALRTIPLGLTIAIEFTGPLTVAILNSRRLGDLVWVALAVFGLALLLPIASGAGHLDLVGVGFACGAAVLWALYIVLGQRTSHLHAGSTVALGMLTAAVLVAPFGVLAAGWRLFDPSIVLAGLVVGVLSSAIPYSLEMVALRGLSKRTLGIMVSLEPAVGALAGFLFLGEVLRPMQWLAIAAIIGASVGAVASNRSRVAREILAT